MAKYCFDRHELKIDGHIRGRWFNFTPGEKVKKVKVLSVNCGSTSLKYKLFELKDGWLQKL